MAEFWLKDKWAVITKDWSGVIRENPWDEELKYDFHLNMMHPYFNVSLLGIASVTIITMALCQSGTSRPYQEQVLC